MQTQEKIGSKAEIIQCDDITNLEGKLLKNRFEIGQYIDGGSQGCVFQCHDLNRPNGSELIVKISFNTDEITNEIRILKQVRKSQKELYGEKCSSYTPTCTNFGMIVMESEEPQLAGYLIMKRYTMNLEQYILSNTDISATNIIQICSGII